MTDSNASLAVLIDGDNASASIVEGLLAEVARFGVANVKRIYGDWTSPALGAWKQVLLEYSIQPVQQFRYTVGKNATDSAMIIDAMDLLYTHRFAGFCLVSSDSDFTRLAARIRESGIAVYGFGEKKTPRPFVSACDKFIYTEVFASQGRGGREMPSRTTLSQKELRADGALLHLIRSGIESASDDDGWASLSSVGSYMNKTSADFDPRNYGFGKLSALISAIGLFEIRRRGFHLYVRDLRSRDGD
jgi:uncharacterized LabA/DUF88 family protein